MPRIIQTIEVPENGGLGILFWRSSAGFFTVSWDVQRKCWVIRLQVDEEVIRAHPQQQIFFNLFAENWHRRQARRSS